MRTGIVTAAAAFGLLSSLALAQPARRQAPEQPASASRQADPNSLKFQPATEEEIRAARAKAEVWAEQTRQLINRNLHAIETPHFLIYSTWDRSNDAALGEACEAMYLALCRQFAIPAGESIWVGKCPVFIFWDENDFRRFTTHIDEVGQGGLGGYMHSDGAGFVHLVVLNRSSKESFLSTLVHEGTHAFLTRYRTNVPAPAWLQEGLAEYMAAEIVKSSDGQKRYVDATREVVQRRIDVSYLFDNVPPTERDYGMVQSLIRYMIARDSKAFVGLVDLIKQGQDWEVALSESYNLTKDRLLVEWFQASSRALQRR